MSWVQYPRIRRVGAKVPFFRHRMPWHIRAALIVFGAITLVVGALGVAGFSFILWATITA